jgi:predicted AAA+ superfamily ATPase
MNKRFRLFYWREQNNEVDFIIESSGKTIGIEVKSGHKRPSKGMSAFVKKFSPHQTMLVGSEGITIEEFLSFNPEELF